jgi:DNA-binding response OmpR family regulator/DNA-binding CsgD family transcriptional regulator
MRNILVVDDVPDNVAVLFDFLREHGFKVLVSESGRHALTALSRSAPDLILLDVMMPEMDGLETCRRIKEDPRFADVPVFFMTALGDPVDKVRGLQAGAADYITKPIFPEEVLARIRVHLELRDRNRELAEQNERLDAAIQQRIAAERALQHTLENAVIVADEHGAIHLCTGAAEQLMRRHFGGNREVRLPSAVAAWLRDRHARQTALALPHASGATLEIQQAPAPGAGALLLLTLGEKSAPPSPARLVSLGLTPRETEILFWIAQGKTSPEIAVILETAPETIKRHVKNFLPKLGVETRLAAALKAMELLGLPR